MKFVALVLAAVYIGGMGLAYGFNLALTPAYHDGSPSYPIWEILNWMGVPVVLALLALYGWRRWQLGGSGDSPLTREYFAVSLSCGASIGLAILYFWQWFWTLWPENEPGEPVVASHLIHFPAVDVLFALLALHAALYLWQQARPLMPSR